MDTRDISRAFNKVNSRHERGDCYGINNDLISEVSILHELPKVKVTYSVIIFRIYTLIILFEKNLLTSQLAKSAFQSEGFQKPCLLVNVRRSLAFENERFDAF